MRSNHEKSAEQDSIASHLLEATSVLFAQLAQFLQPIDPSVYTRSVPILQGASLGQHTRHLLEFYICFLEALPSKTLNYEHRKHDFTLETNPQAAIAQIDTIYNRLRSLTSVASEDTPLLVEVQYYSPKTCKIQSNLYREWVYAIEHAVHHMALLRVGVTSVCPEITLAPEFGVAADTLRYKAAM